MLLWTGFELAALDLSIQQHCVALALTRTPGHLQVVNSLPLSKSWAMITTYTVAVDGEDGMLLLCEVFLVRY